MIPRRLAILLALTTSTVLAASPPAIVNLSFQQRDAASGTPTGWKTFGEGYELRTECTQACAVQLQSRDAAAKQFALAQEVAAGGAAGHRLILSGRIRTEQVEGNALLYVGVAGESMSMGEHTSGPATPSGSTAWKPFEVIVPVPANATKLFIGFGINGKGGAWFDSLALKVDESVTVPAAVPPPPPPPPVSPPRPVPSQALLDDAALRIAPTDIPAIGEAWRADVLARRHPIRSLFSDDFSDLQFLKPLLAGKRIVQLGEAAHGVAEFSWEKVRLIKFLHQQMGFDVIAFESALVDCYDANQLFETLPPRDVMRKSILPNWRTTEVSGLFEYMAAIRKSARPLTLAGFDTQFSTWPTDRSRLRAMLAIAAAPLAPRLQEFEDELAAGKVLTVQRSGVVQAFYADIARALNAHRAALHAGGYGQEIDLEIQGAQARIWLARQFEHLTEPNSMAGNAVRDAGMAEQMDFLLDKLYPGRKIIVWAHNAHLTYAQAAGGFKSMGANLAERRRADMYTVGFYMGRGVVNNGYPPNWQVQAPPPDTVDAVLANGGMKYAFVDFSKAAPSPSTTWFTEQNKVREFGTVANSIVPARSYDAIFYVDTVTPAEKF